MNKDNIAEIFLINLKLKIDLDFIRESNKIEGIHRDVTNSELKAYKEFMALETITMDDLPRKPGYVTEFD